MHGLCVLGLANELSYVYSVPCCLCKKKEEKKNIHTQQYARYCCLSISTDHLHGPSKCRRFLDLHRTADARPALNKRCVSHFVQVVRLECVLLKKPKTLVCTLFFLFIRRTAWCCSLAPLSAEQCIPSAVVVTALN